MTIYPTDKLNFDTNFLEFNGLKIECSQSRLHGVSPATVQDPYLRVDIEQDQNIGLSFWMPTRSRRILDAHISYPDKEFEIECLDLVVLDDPNRKEGRIIKNLNQLSNFTIIAGPNNNRLTFILEAITSE